MDPTVAKLIKKLRNNELSRNRNFELFKTPLARRALHVHLLLRQLEKELFTLAASDSAQVRLEEDNGRMVVRMDDASLRLRRRVYLTRAELAFLIQDPRIARLLYPPQKRRPAQASFR